MWWLFAILSAFFASLTAIFAKLGLSGINSNIAVAVRTVIIFCMTVLIILSGNTAKDLNMITNKNILFLVLSGVSTGASWMFYSRALQIGNVSQVAAIDKLSVALTIILSCLLLGEPISFKTMTGVILIITGVVVLILK